MTDLGLVYLCGPEAVVSPTRFGRYVPKLPRGCKYLREFVFNPAPKPILPKVSGSMGKHNREL